MNNRVYILNKPTLEFISMRGPFADPENVNECCEECSGSCYDKDGKFLIPTNYLVDIKNILYKEYSISKEEDKSQYEIEINK